MKIGEKTLKKGGEMLTSIMLSYISKINEAFLHNGESELKIGLDLTIKPGAANGNFKLQSGIKFITEQIKDTFSDSCDELQTNLFEEGFKKCPLRPNDRMKESYCDDKCDCRIERIFVKGKKMPVVLPFRSEEPILAESEMIQYRSCASWADQDFTAFTAIMVNTPIPEKVTLKKIAGGLH
jgi:hypothetical protein